MIDNLYYTLLGLPFIGLLMIIFATKNENLNNNLNKIKNFICFVMIACSFNLIYITNGDEKIFKTLDILSFEFTFYKFLIVIFISIYYITKNFSKELYEKDKVSKINSFVYMALYTNFVFIVMAKNHYVYILGISTLSIIFYLYYFSNQRLVTLFEKLFIYSFMFLIFILLFIFFHNDAGILIRFLLVVGVLFNIFLFRNLIKNQKFSFELINVYLIILLILMYLYININFSKYITQDIFLSGALVVSLIIIFFNKNNLHDLHSILADYICISILTIFTITLNVKSFVVLYEKLIGLYLIYVVSLFAFTFFIKRTVSFYNSKFLKNCENKLLFNKVCMILIILNIMGIPFSFTFDYYIRIFEISLDIGIINSYIFGIIYLIFVIYNFHIINKLKNV